jgi:hypothetical protein
MAKALIAAVSLAVVLVAAVVVPLALTPGAYGFDDWPESKPVTPHAQIVSVEVPERKPAARPPVVAPHRELASAAPRPTAPAPAPTAVQGTQHSQPQPTLQAQPQAAPEQPQAAPVVDARDHNGDVPNAISGHVQPGRAVDGTNQP